MPTIAKNYVLLAFLAITILFISGVVNVPNTYAQSAPPSFRVISVADHQGQLLVEVEHFKSDGTFDYFENYVWQGREGNVFPPATNNAGQLLLESGAIAPYRINPGTGDLQQYRGLEGQQYKLRTSPTLDTEALLSVIQQIHNERENWSDADWPSGQKRGQNRLTEPDMPYSEQDSAGVSTLVSKLMGVTGQGYIVQNDGNRRVYRGPLPVILGLGLPLSLPTDSPALHTIWIRIGP